MIILQGERAGPTEAEGHAGVYPGVQGGQRAVEDHRATEDGGGKQVCWFCMRKITTPDLIFVG